MSHGEYKLSVVKPYDLLSNEISLMIQHTALLLLLVSGCTLVSYVASSCGVHGLAKCSAVDGHEGGTGQRERSLGKRHDGTSQYYSESRNLRCHL